MKWFRLAGLLVIVGLAVLALTQTAGTSNVKSAERVPVPTPLPTRAPLPTLAPQVIISRTSREPLATPTPEPTPTQPVVYVVDYGFSPGQLLIHAGQRVTWVNQGADGHDITGSDWHSGPLTPAEAYTRAFLEPGTFPYECTIHPEMRGSVIVEP